MRLGENKFVRQGKDKLCILYLLDPPNIHNPGHLVYVSVVNKSPYKQTNNVGCKVLRVIMSFLTHHEYNLDIA